MKKFLSLLLSALMLLSCFSGMTFTVAAADVSGLETISFSKGGVGSSPYMSGLNNPVGYYFKLDSEKKLLNITIPEFATYGQNVNKGTFKLYQWKEDYATTKSSTPLVERVILNHVDHDALVLEIDASLNVTGELYFEVICLEGSSYTPWSADKGQIDAIPGVVTDMQAYLGGSPANPFACEITVCDMENKSASAHITYEYDFTDGLIAADYAQLNEISIINQDGYVTFKADGTDPYLRFSDDLQPTPYTSELGYIVIEYRTAAEIGAGEIFTNRRSGAHWGDAGSYVTWNYNNDGDWHTVVVDASAVWGNANEDGLYAFRFDPLASGATAGDTIDVASMKFFAEAVYAESYAAEREAELEEERANEMSKGSSIIDLGAGKLPDDFTCNEAVTVYVESDFTRFITEAGAQMEKANASVPATFKYVKLAYRTEEAAGVITITAHMGEETASLTVEPRTDGYWYETVVELPVPAEVTEETVIDRVTVDCPTGWVDVTYLGFFNQEAYAKQYTYGRTLNTHQYILGTTNVPVYNVTDTTLGNPFCAGGESYGQKFVADSVVTGIIVPGHATWGADTNEGYFKLFAWNTDYATTVAGTPLVEQSLSNLKDGEDLVITFDELPAGEYCFEVKMTTPGDKAYTGFQPVSGSATDGTVSFRNGSVNSAALVAGYLTLGTGMQDVGDEYGMNVTFEYDFTRHYDSVTESFGLTNLSGVTVTDLCDQGYLNIKALQNDPYFAFGIDPAVTSNLMDHVVIKYRTETTAKSGELFVDRSDGVTWGNPYAKSNLLWDWTADGEWHIAIIDASAVWGSVYDVTLSNLRFDPLEKPTGAGETIDVAYIKFFANAKAAEEYAASEYVIEGDSIYVKAPLKPIDPATVTPVIIFEGETLNVSGGSQVQDASYDFDKGYLTLIATGSDPFFYIYRESTTIAPVMAVKYRTSARNVKGEIFTSSVQTTPYGRGDYGSFSLISDGQWHTAIIDLSTIADYDTATNTVNYLRYDFLASDSGVSSGSTLEVEYIAFFQSVDEATVYQHTLPEERTTHIVTFIVNGIEMYTVTFREGDTSLDEPVVPIIPGQNGAWEPYELGNTDLTVHAVYTSASEDTVPDMPDGITPPEGGDTTEPTPDTDAEPDTAAPDTESGEVETQVGGGQGCGSVVGLSLPLLLLLAAVLVALRKKETTRA